MKLLLVMLDEQYKKNISFHLKPLWFEIIHYDHPIKALDNIDEVEPDIILFNALDFPRHWKPYLNMLRIKKSRNESIFILIAAHDMDIDEASKAVHLGVNGIMPSRKELRQDVYQLTEICKRYVTLDDGRNAHRHVPGEVDNINMLFTDPETFQIISGQVLDISITGVSFKPEIQHLTDKFKNNDTIKNCSIRLGSNVVTADSIVRRNNGILGLEFSNFKKNGEDLLKRYIDAHSERLLKQAMLRQD